MSHQEIPIAVAEIVGISKGDKTSYDRELDQRIASVILELQKKSEQAEGIETEIRTLKTSLEPLLGCTFMRRIEEDPTWSDPISVAFDTKFLEHEIPAVANVAALVKRSHILKDEHRALDRKLEHFREDQLHNNYIPAELFRFIEDLRSEVASLRSIVLELSEEKRSREEKEKNRVVFEFNTLPPNIIIWDVADHSCTLTYNGVNGFYNNAISSVPLPRDRPSQWQITITSLSTYASGWVMLGVVPGEYMPATARSIDDSSSYGWACSNQVYCAGSCKLRYGSWGGWQERDRGIFTYDPTAATLALRLVRGGITQEFRLDNCVLPQAFIHANFVGTDYDESQVGTSVRFTNIVVA